jgi:hypothetical protein
MAQPERDALFRKMRCKPENKVRWTGARAVGATGRRRILVRRAARGDRRANGAQKRQPGVAGPLAAAPTPAMPSEKPGARGGVGARARRRPPSPPVAGAKGRPAIFCCWPFPRGLGVVRAAVALCAVPFPPGARPRLPPSPRGGMTPVRPVAWRGMPETELAPPLRACSECPAATAPPIEGRLFFSFPSPPPAAPPPSLPPSPPPAPATPTLSCRSASTAPPRTRPGRPSPTASLCACRVRACTARSESTCPLCGPPRSTPGPRTSWR